MPRRYRIAALLKGLRLECDKHSENISEAYNGHLAWLREATEASKEKIMTLKMKEEEKRRLSGVKDKERDMQVELFRCNKSGDATTKGGVANSGVPPSGNKSQHIVGCHKMEELTEEIRKLRGVKPPTLKVVQLKATLKEMGVKPRRLKAELIQQLEEVVEIRIQEIEEKLDEITTCHSEPVPESISVVDNDASVSISCTDNDVVLTGEKLVERDDETQCESTQRKSHLEKDMPEDAEIPQQKQQLIDGEEVLQVVARSSLDLCKLQHPPVDEEDIHSTNSLNIHLDTSSPSFVENDTVLSPPCLQPSPRRKKCSSSLRSSSNERSSGPMALNMARHLRSSNLPSMEDDEVSNSVSVATDDDETNSTSTTMTREEDDAISDTHVDMEISDKNGRESMDVQEHVVDSTSVAMEDNGVNGVQQSALGMDHIPNDEHYPSPEEYQHESGATATVISCSSSIVCTDTQNKHNVEHENNVSPSENRVQLRFSCSSVALQTPDGKVTEDFPHGLQDSEPEPEHEPDQGREVLPEGSPQTISANSHLPPDGEGSANDWAASTSNVVSGGSPTTIHRTNALDPEAHVDAAPLAVSSSKLPTRLPPTNLVSGLHSFTSLVSTKTTERLDATSRIGKPENRKVEIPALKQALETRRRQEAREALRKQQYNQNKVQRNKINGKEGTVTTGNSTHCGHVQEWATGRRALQENRMPDGSQATQEDVEAAITRRKNAIQRKREERVAKEEASTGSSVTTLIPLSSSTAAMNSLAARTAQHANHAAGSGLSPKSRAAYLQEMEIGRRRAELEEKERRKEARLEASRRAKAEAEEAARMAKERRHAEAAERRRKEEVTHIATKRVVEDSRFAGAQPKATGVAPSNHPPKDDIAVPDGPQEAPTPLQPAKTANILNTPTGGTSTYQHPIKGSEGPAAQYPHQAKPNMQDSATKHSPAGGVINYEISDQHSSADEDSDPELQRRRAEKARPRWARGSPLKRALQEQYGAKGLDPDSIFGDVVETCDLDAIFVETNQAKKARYARRGSSADWGPDRLTQAERVAYRRQVLAQYIRKG